MTTVKTSKRAELQAQKRLIVGHKVKHLRTDGFVPAVLYGKDMDTVSLQIPYKDFEHMFGNAGESTLVYLNVDGQSYPTIIHDVARNPLTDSIIHADFYKVRLDEKIKAKVPVVFAGESPAVKDFGGIFVRNVNELEVEALPQNLPHEIIIDLTLLKNFGDQILFKDIDTGINVKILGREDEIAATVQKPLSEDELKASLEAPVADVSAVKEIKREEKPEETEESAMGTTEVKKSE